MRSKVILIKSIILYGSHYGSSRRYAQKLSEQTNIPAVCYKNTPSLSDKNPIIYLGSMYAGGILELKKTLHGFSLRDRQKLILVTVNLSDPELQENQKIYDARCKNNFQPNYITSQKFFICKVQLIIKNFRCFTRQ